MSDALTLYQPEKIKLASDRLSALEKVVLAQVDFFRRNQPETASRIILAALGMRRIKASVGHGNWEPWQKRNIVPILGPAASRTIRNWMRLADRFVEDSELTLPEFLSLPGDQTELALNAKKDESARRLMARLEKFVGDLGPTELMVKHGIRDNDRRNRIASHSGSKAPTEDERELTMQERFNDVEEHLRLALTGALDRATWMGFTRKQHEDLRYIFEEAAEKVVAQFIATHPQKKGQSS